MWKHKNVNKKICTLLMDWSNENGIPIWVTLSKYKPIIALNSPMRQYEHWKSTSSLSNGHLAPEIVPDPLKTNAANLSRNCLFISLMRWESVAKKIDSRYIWMVKGSGTLLVRLYKDDGTPSTECSLTKFWKALKLLSIGQFTWFK